ncbi:hydroxyacylglutathione hydrolase [Saezia sanguinis]|nr:hydroxyacylglutathione hydrolase [Saezia sanguinis]
MNLIAIPALSDNYIWMLHNGHQALVVDPGDATPVISTLQACQLELAAILVTHHHADHTAGIAALRPYLAGEVWGPAEEAVPEPYQPVHEGRQLHLLGLDLEVYDIPGHTAGHIAFYIPAPQDALQENQAPIVFCGDTLFSAGCGRIFEGTPEQMLHSLDKLAALPEQTRVCCAHEYTLSNLRFAQVVEPDNADISLYAEHCQQLRTKQQPTLPSQIGQELRINPFLRSRKSSIIGVIQAHNPAATDDVAVFAALRHWKDNFK